VQRRCDRWRSDRQRACGLAHHTRGIPRVDLLTGRDDAGRVLPVMMLQRPSRSMIVNGTAPNTSTYSIARFRFGALGWC